MESNLLGIEEYLSSIMEENFAAKASLSIAFYDLMGKLQNKPAREILGIPFQKEILTSYTIGIDSLDIIKIKVKEAQEYEYLKIKSGTSYDLEIIDTVRSVTDKPLFIDANQGWKTKENALRMIESLYKSNVKVIEQPLPINLYEDSFWLKERSPLPIIADESVRTVTDLYKFGELFHGVNLKLMKCGGMRTALEMINYCREKKLQIMIGCMTETSCAISAAANLAIYADYNDLDGNVLIKNDPFIGVETRNGKLVNNTKPGFGLTKK